MKTKINLFLLIILSSVIIISCGKSNDKKSQNIKSIESHEDEHDEEEHGHGEEEEQVHLSSFQVKAMGMKFDTLQIRNMGEYVETNGTLQVPPQNEATVTAIIGANISSIEVIEGDKVKKGQILAYLSHPNLIKLQTEFISKWNELNYLEKEYQRQKKLYDEKIGSGKQYQKTQSEYLSLKGSVEGLKVQLEMLGLNVSRLLENKLYERVPLFSPISGYVRLVEIKTGQYVPPSAELFEIVNIDEIHADLMVFEKDMNKIKKGQKVRIFLESQKELYATIRSVGKAFEQNPKAIHLHAEIENKEGLLIPGMYIRGQVLTSERMTLSLPEEAIVREDDKNYIFTIMPEDMNYAAEFKFTLVEVIAGITSDGFVEIKLLKPMKKGANVVLNNAYYLYAEMKKGEAEHSH